MAGPETRTLPRRDGRTLAWCEYGDPLGPPLLFFHGLPGSRLFRLPEWSRPDGTRLRIVAPDRPGMGRSTLQPRRRLLDWPADVLALADHLGLDRFLVAGISGGGPHALVCAARLPGRVAACALLSSAAPLDDPALRRGMHAGNRLVFALARHAPPLLRAAFWLTSKSGGRADQAKYLAAAAKLMPPADVAALRDPELFAVLLEAGREGTRPGVRGAVDEAVMLSRPWGFNPEEVTVPTFLWQGGADRNVPRAAGEWLAGRIPGCAAHYDEQAGHMLSAGRWPEIEAALLSAW